MIKKKSKMNKIIMWGLIATASLSLASVGFASWVINTIVPGKVDNMDIAVGAVSDESITATAAEVPDGKKRTGLIFDNLADGTEGSNIQNGDGSVEKLSFTIKTTLKIKDGNFQDLLTSLSFTFNDALNKAVTDDYITMPFATNNKQVITLKKTASGNQFEVTYLPANNVAIEGITGNTYTYTTDAKEINISTTFTCGWGSKFNNDNPGKLTFSDTDNITAGKITKETFKSYINGLSTALTDKKLNVTVTPNGK